jgi:hypothetical protein
LSDGDIADITALTVSMIRTVSAEHPSEAT